jgi:uncharacterized protein (DUF305 family)
MKKAFVIAVAGIALMSAVAYAQMQPGPSDSKQGATGPGGMHGGMHGSMSGSQDMQPKGDTGPSSLAYHAANMKMHSAMDIAFTGNADVDFVKGMIPHHAAAIDMAKVELAFGKDPEVKKLAEAIIKAQETEIAQMQDWLKKRGQ